MGLADSPVVHISVCVCTGSVTPSLCGCAVTCAVQIEGYQYVPIPTQFYSLECMLDILIHSKWCASVDIGTDQDCGAVTSECFSISMITVTLI